MSKKIEAKPKIFDRCPHCGTELSPWEKVLLSVDRALMCKHCWYRILLDTIDGAHDEPAGPETPTKDRQP